MTVAAAEQTRQARLDRLQALRGELIDRSGERAWFTVKRHQELATGYVWGWQDALAEGQPIGDRLAIIDTEEATDFGREYAIHAARYALERAPGRTNPGNAWKRWRNGQTDESEWLK
ncbi:MAG: hypothetical protein M3N52_12035 [Actinomycetota bacterium]|nr:hypothetical protein [Actinomycetota bacterium]